MGQGSAEGHYHALRYLCLCNVGTGLAGSVCGNVCWRYAQGAGAV